MFSIQMPPKSFQIPAIKDTLCNAGLAWHQIKVWAFTAREPFSIHKPMAVTQGQSRGSFFPLPVVFVLRTEFIPLAYTPSSFLSLKFIIINTAKCVEQGHSYMRLVFFWMPVRYVLSSLALWPLILSSIWKTLFKHYKAEQDAQKNGSEDCRDNIFTQGS